MKMLLIFAGVVLLTMGLHACSTAGGVVSATNGSLPADAPVHTESRRPRGVAADESPAVVGSPAGPSPSLTYRIGPHDLLNIQVFQVEELSTQERVSEEGLIVMPLIGKVKVGGLTPQEAEALIAERLGENYLQDPQVNIFVMEYASQKVTVTGQVKQPGVFPLTGETTLMQAIALAGGVDRVAKKQEIIIFRKQTSGGVNGYVVDLAAVEKGELADPRIHAQDRVVVPKSGVAQMGQTVNNVLTGWALRVPFL